MRPDKKKENEFYKENRYFLEILKKWYGLRLYQLPHKGRCDCVLQIAKAIALSKVRFPKGKCLLHSTADNIGTCRQNYNLNMEYSGTYLDLQNYYDAWMNTLNMIKKSREKKRYIRTVHATCILLRPFSYQMKPHFDIFQLLLEAEW